MRSAGASHRRLLVGCCGGDGEGRPAPTKADSIWIERERKQAGRSLTWLYRRPAAEEPLSRRWWCICVVIGQADEVALQIDAGPEEFEGAYGVPRSVLQVGLVCVGTVDRQDAPGMTEETQQDAVEMREERLRCRTCAIVSTRERKGRGVANSRNPSASRRAPFRFDAVARPPSHKQLHEPWQHAGR